MTALGGGLVSFFAPCVIPLIPAYISYISGVSLKELKKGKLKKYRGQILLNSTLYLLGFSLIFVVLGAFAGSLGYLLRIYERQIQTIGGIFLIVFGLQTAQVINPPQLNFKWYPSIPSWTGNFGGVKSFFIGNVFALAWTPCVSAILASILTLATVGADPLGGALLLFIYSLGISIPFIIVSFTLSATPAYLKIAQQHTGTISYLTGLILAIVGIMLLTDTFTTLNNLASLGLAILGIYPF